MGQPLFDLISNIIKRRSYPSISDGMHLEIRIKKCGISTPSVFASVMIRVFPSFEHSTGVSATRRHTRGLSKRGRDTESDAKIRQEEMYAFFSTNVPATFPSEIEGHDLFSIIVLTT